MKFKIWSEKMNIEYMLMQCCIVEKKMKRMEVFSIIISDKL